MNIYKNVGNITLHTMTTSPREMVFLYSKKLILPRWILYRVKGRAANLNDDPYH